MNDQPSGAQRLADEIGALVRSTPVGGIRGDSAGLIMHSAYLQAYRRFVSIRSVAGNDAGPEAVILARSLLSLVARAAYVDAPTNPAERKRRFFQYRVHDLTEEIRNIRRLAQSGFDVDSDTSAQEVELAEIGDVGGFPNDASLMRDHLNLGAFHARLYAPGSDHVHFSQRVALGAVRGVEAIDFDAGDPELADEALRLAILTYGQFLTLSERAVGHGLADRVLDLVKPLFASD